MSSLPGLTLEDYVMWLLNFKVEGRQDVNPSLGIADLVGHHPSKRLVVDKINLPPVVSHFEPYRESIEQRLEDFDEETQSWRGYSACLDELYPESAIIDANVTLALMARVYCRKAAGGPATEPSCFSANNEHPQVRAENGCDDCAYDNTCRAHYRAHMAAEGYKARIATPTSVVIEDTEEVSDSTYDEVERLEAEVARLKQHNEDLLSGRYVNCVFCGHRYGPGEKTVPTSALVHHMLECLQHPMSRVRAIIDRFQGQLRPENDLENLRTKEEGWDMLVGLLQMVRDYAQACETQEAAQKKDLLDRVVQSLREDPDYQEDLAGLTDEAARQRVTDVLKEHVL